MRFGTLTEYKQEIVSHHNSKSNGVCITDVCTFNTWLQVVGKIFQDNHKDSFLLLIINDTAFRSILSYFLIMTISILIHELQQISFLPVRFDAYMYVSDLFWAITKTPTIQVLFQNMSCGRSARISLEFSE